MATANIGNAVTSLTLAGNPTIVAASTYILLAADTEVIVNFAGTCTVTLPTAASSKGRVFTVRTCQAQTVVSASTNVSKNQAADAAAILAATIGAWAEVRSDGTHWVIVRNN